MAGAGEIEVMRLDLDPRRRLPGGDVGQFDAEADAKRIAPRDRRYVDLAAHAAIAARVRDSDSPSGSARAATLALATASTAFEGASLPASAGAMTSAEMRR